MSARWMALCCVASLAIACAPKVHVENPSPFDEDDPAAGGTSTSARGPSDAPSRATPTPPPRDAKKSGTLRRTTLVSVLDRGPALFLASLEISAEFSGNRFTGWRIVRFAHGNPLYYSVDLRPGDIIRRVNRHRLERPNQLQKLWKELRTASEIVVEAERSGRTHTLRFAVVDAA